MPRTLSSRQTAPLRAPPVQEQGHDARWGGLLLATLSLVLVLSLWVFYSRLL